MVKPTPAAFEETSTKRGAAGLSGESGKSFGIEAAGFPDKTQTSFDMEPAGLSDDI